MDSVRKLVLISCILAIAISVFDMLYPGKKFEKQMRLLLSLVFVIGIITPVFTGAISFTVPTFASVRENQNYNNLQDSVYQSYQSNIKENIENNLTKIIRQNEINVKEISVSINIDEDNCISISEVSIIPEDNKDTAEIISIIKSEVGIEPNIMQGEESNG